MKQKTLTGLRAGVYRESSNQKSALLDLLASVLIFLALAAVCYTVSGFSAMLWLLGAGILTCIAAAIIRHFQKTKLLFPILLAALLLVVLFARNPLLNGFGAAWNTLRDLWAAEKGILLPLAETNGSGLWLAGIVSGILLAMVSVALSRVPTLTAVLLAALSVAAAFMQPGFLLLAAAAIALLMLTWQKNKNAVSAASFLIVGVIVAGIAAISLQTGTMQALSENAKNALHYWRYEKAGEVLPEGNLSEPVTKTESTDAILSVTADTAQTLYLRGFVGDSYENGVWSALDAEAAAEEKDLFYWLHQSGFYPQSQLASAARLMGNYRSGSVSVQNLTGCSLYRYEPCTILPERAWLARNKIQPSAVETSGLRGERGYSYETVSDAQTLLPELLDFLQNDTSDGVKSYLQMESAYREFVYSYALTVPAESRAQLGAVLDSCCESYGPADDLTKEQGAGLVNVKNVVTTKASPAPTARRSGPSARITCARHSSSAPTASTARRSSATAGSAAHGTRRPKPMTATITLHCLRQWQSERLFMGIYTVVIFIELILGNALTKFVLSNTMKEKSKTRYENHIP